MTPRSPTQRVRDIMSAVATIEQHRRRSQELGLDSDDPLVLDATTSEQ